MVISVAVLATGGDPAGYYLDRRAGCAADYYTGMGERAGVWLGTGAAAVGLTGQLDPAGEQTLRALLAGHAPDGRVLVPPVLRADPRGRLPAAPLAEAIRAHADARGLPVEALLTKPADQAAFTVLTARVDQAPGGRSATVDPAHAGRLAAAAGLDPHHVYRGKDGADRYGAALAHANSRVDVRRAGIDVTISAPKSVSILYGLGPPSVAAVVRQAHHTAVGEALGYLESVAGHGLRGHHGDGRRATRIGTGGWIVAAFEHRTSRAKDPQLHTHIVVPNLLHGADGKWSAVDSRAVHRHALTASYLYHAVLRGQLTARLGVAWTPPEKGVAEIAGIPGGLLELFSTRRRQIVTALDQAGRHGPAAAQAACLATRPPKDATAPPDTTLRQAWAARARAAGHDPDRVIGDVIGRVRPPRSPQLDALIAELLGPAGLTAHATGFDRRDLLQALCQSLPPGLLVDRTRLEAAANLVLRHRDAIRLATRTQDGGRWSTAELLTVEQRALHLADELRAGRPRDAAIGVTATGTDTADPSLSGEQQRMVAALATAAGLAVVVGPAGAGKTAALAAATHAWRTQDRPVIGAALAAVTARRLEHATGIPSTSLARLLTAVNATDPDTGRPAGLPHRGVVVVDEASMVDTRTLAALLAHTKEAAGTLVLVGDPAQLPEIRAGGLFAALARNRDTIVLTDNRRQTEPWERRALADLRAGDPHAALVAYVAHQRLHTAPSGELAERIVTDYLRHRTEAVRPDEVVMLAVRRAEVAQLNTAARERLIAAQQLGDDAVVVGSGDRQREYRRGDQVIVTANDQGRRLLNGTRATLTHVDPQQRMLTLATDDNRQITVPTGWAVGRLDHGYALTCHKAQGATVDTALLYGAGTLGREAGYVGLSRGRRANHLYVPDDLALTEPEDSRLLDLAAELAASRAQAMATRQLPHARAMVGHRPLPPEQHGLHVRSEGIWR